MTKIKHFTELTSGDLTEEVQAFANSKGVKVDSFHFLSNNQCYIVYKEVKNGDARSNGSRRSTSRSGLQTKSDKRN
jgi:hypothetical protein